jgi:hypothetical protein
MSDSTIGSKLSNRNFLVYRTFGGCKRHTGIKSGGKLIKV